jgi:hypothetical protein
MNYKAATCLTHLILILFNNLVRPLTRRQNDNLAPKLGKVANCLRQNVLTMESHKTRILLFQASFHLAQLLTFRQGCAETYQTLLILYLCMYYQDHKSVKYSVTQQ